MPPKFRAIPNRCLFCMPQLINVLLAARDTTAALLTTVLYFLTLHPEVVGSLRREILTVKPTGSPSRDDIRQLEYCTYQLLL